MITKPTLISVDEDGTETWDIGEGPNLVNVHPGWDCGGDNCVLHNPSSHHMSEFPLHWRYDRGIFERICEHGVGHPDPDQSNYWKQTDQEFQGVHGCDGCCSPGGYEALQSGTSETDEAHKKMVEEIKAAKAEADLVRYKLDHLLRRLNRASEMDFKVTLDEWEVTAVAKILKEWLY